MLADTVKRPGRANPHTIRAQVEIRDLILGGRLGRGHRISETAMAERIGVSRTPVRAALKRLHAEGLIAPGATGGYCVNSLSEREIYDRIELRGLLEGLMARLAAERGVSPAEVQPLRACLDGVDRILARSSLGRADFAEFVQLNARFHQLLRKLSRSGVVMRQVVRAGGVPFDSPTALALAESKSRRGRAVLLVAQDQHRAVLDAIVEREGARAESIMREHARVAGRTLGPLLAGNGAFRLTTAGSPKRNPRRARRSEDAPIH